MDDYSADVSLIQSIPAVPTILDVICKTTGMGFAAVARVTEGRWIACRVLDHIHFGLKAGGELEVESTICHEIRQVQEPVVIDHVAEDEIYKDHHTPRMYGFQSYISMPIFLSGGRFYGTLCAIDPKPARVNTPEIVGMFRLFAELIATHIDTAERLAASESDLLAARQASELREQFIAVLGHDLRNPLGAIAIGAELLWERGPDPKEGRIINMMRQSSASMSALIDDVMDFARGRLGGGLSIHRTAEESLEPVVEQAIAEMRTIWPDRVIETEIQIGGTIDADKRRLAQLFTNLLSNAMSHGHAEQPVKVRAVRDGGRFEFSVANASDPIPENVLDRLFEPFSRGKDGNAGQGLGLGLYIAAQIAKAHGGTLEVTSDAEETRFSFSMPV